MMDRGQPSPHDQRHQQQSQQPYETQPSPAPRSHLSRSISYPVPTQNSYAAQIPENISSTSLPMSQPKEEQYAGLGISVPTNENPHPHLLPSPDSPFGTQPLLSRYGTGQPLTPSFPILRSSSPASSVWSASDPGTTTNLSGFIPRLYKYLPNL
jgi:hypothetical protein